MKNEKDLKIMQFFFPWYRYFYITRINDNGEIFLSCKKLNKKGECTIYKFRPLLCRNYPKKYISFNTKMPDGCGFTIESKNFKDYL